MRKVTIYSGDPCPYCNAAKALLKSKNVEIEELIFGKTQLKPKKCYKELMGKNNTTNIYWYTLCRR